MELGTKESLQNWTVNGALKVAGGSMDTGPTTPTLYVYGDGNFNTAWNLPGVFFHKVRLQST